jgi:ferredoxin
VLETVDEDEVYDLQFGSAFAAAATSPSSAAVQRDDYALEIAMGDE